MKSAARTTAAQNQLHCAALSMVSEYTHALTVIQARIPNVYSNAHYLSEHEGPLFASLVLS